MISRVRVALLVATALPVLTSAPLHAEQPVVDASLEQADYDPWPFAASDLPVDPAYRFGALANGMRYIIRPNASPPGQGKVQLWVNFGSAAEEDSERGLAHFIEHMAFNGSTNLPEGEMVKLLEREGLAFGADTNASTGFDTTLYKLELPRNDMALLNTALMLMRETASEISFNEDAVAREKGVILSERRVRDTYALRGVADQLRFFYPEARFSDRMPIGKTRTIEATTGEQLRDLYRRYYRPDNAALIVVGDYDADAVEALVRQHFSSWNPTNPVPLPEFGPVDPAQAGEDDIYLHAALPEKLTIARHAVFEDRPDTIANRQQNILRQVGYGILNRRLQRLSRLEDPPFRAATLATGDFLEVSRITSLDVLPVEGKWQQGLAAAQEEYRRALAYGFTAAEVREQVAQIEVTLNSQAEGADTISNAQHMAGAISVLREEKIPTTPQSALERFNSFKPEITPEAVFTAWREELVVLENPLIRWTGPTDPEGGSEAIRLAWETGMQREISPNEEAEAAEFSYTDFGSPGKVVSDTVDERLGVREVRFANGVMLNMKRTDLEADRVLVQLNVDGGDMLDTRDNPLATALVGSLNLGGLGAHTYDELQTIFAGKKVSLDVSSADETFRISAQTTPRDLELQLQVIAAALTDPGFRPTAEAQYRQSVRNFFARLAATPASALSTAIGGILSDDDPRFALQPEEAYMALTFAKLREDMIARWTHGAAELALVGDIDEERAIALVAATLGALPPRETAFASYEAERQRSFTADRSIRTIYHDGAANQAQLVMSWPTRDDSNQREAQTLELLEKVMRLELIDILREELGKTYSPSVSATQSRVNPGYGTFTLSAAIDTAEVASTRDAMLAALEKVRSGGFDDDTLLRARQPMLERFDNSLHTNRGWMSLVDRAQTESERIDRYLAGKAQLQSLKADEIRAMAVRYLDPASRLEVVVLPRPKAD